MSHVCMQCFVCLLPVLADDTLVLAHSPSCFICFYFSSCQVLFAGSFVTERQGLEGYLHPEHPEFVLLCEQSLQSGSNVEHI